MSGSDLRHSFWLLRLLPVSWRPYALLARWDRPIGIWLLLLPGWWSLALAAPRWPDGHLMMLFALGAVVMRGAGCTINDIVDRKLDAQVARTRVRPLPAGLITLRQAILFLAVQLFLGLLVLLQLPKPAIALGAASLLLVALYPFMKRITWMPQFFLGLTFNWGALLGWTAIKEELSAPAFLLYCGAILWTIVYDTIYAHQDRQDDALIGVKSSARLFGRWSRFLVLIFFMGAVAFWGTAGLAFQEGVGFFVGLAIVAGHGLYQILRWNMNDPADCLARFRSSRDLGLIMLGAIIVGKLF